MSSKSLAIWNQSLNFHFSNWKTLLPVFPLLCLPVVGDVLHSLLIAQKVRGNGLIPARAAREVDNSVILTHGFVKKSQRTPAGEIERAEAYRRDFLKRRV